LPFRIWLQSMRIYSYLVAILIATLAIIVKAHLPVVAAETVTLTPLPRLQPQDAPAEAAPAPSSIRFVTSDDYPPFNYVGGDGVLSGFNVELARAICVRLGVGCTVQVRPFPLLVETLVDNKADAIVAGVRDTPALRRYLDYTHPYFRLPARFVMTKTNAATSPTPATLAGRRVAVTAATRYADFLADFLPDAVVVPTDGDAVSFASLKEGKVDAVFTGAVAGAFWLSGKAAAGCCAFAGGAYTETAYFGDGLSIAVARDNPTLKSILNRALRDLEVEGVVDDLALRFLPMSLY
jgi:polar amino acid transport system substrate-binding protein